MTIDLRHGDCLEVLSTVEDLSIDLTVTSPPYDNLRTYGGHISQWSFDKFKGIAKELYRVTKPGGVVVWVVGDATVNGSESCTSFKQALWFVEVGFNLHDTMIYEKNNPVPQVDTSRYTQSFEYMFVFSKGKPKTVHRIEERCEHTGVVHVGVNKTNNENNDRKINREVKKFKPLKNIWKYNVGNNQSSRFKDACKVPAIFPEKLAEDHILSWSDEGDTVLDCFLGSGTTGAMSVKNNRNFVGIEINKEYYDIATTRINDVVEMHKFVPSDLFSEGK